MEKTESTVLIDEGNDDTKCTIQQTNNSALSHSQNQDCKVETSEESYQARALSGSPKNGDPTTPSLLAGQVSESAEKPLGCNQGSASTAVILEKDHVKQTGEAILASLCKRKCSWGLIWRKKKLDLNTWEDFVSRKVILNGNPDMCPLTPTCHYCSQPYDSDLMYIQCETCPCWYHADAVGLEEKKIHDLVGFKCCKCRKIRKPACPYSASDYRRSLEVKRLQVKASTVDNIAVGPSHGSVQEQQDLQPKSAEETPHDAQDDHLTIASSQIRPQSENSPKLYHELDFAIDSGPQKLPVRRSVKHEKEENPLTADDSEMVSCNRKQLVRYPHQGHGGLMSSAEMVMGTEDLLHEILLWVSSRSLLRLQCVSKEWASLISDVCFLRVHTQKITSAGTSSAIFLVGECTKSPIYLSKIENEYQMVKNYPLEFGYGRNIGKPRRVRLLHAPFLQWLDLHSLPC